MNIRWQSAKTLLTLAGILCSGASVSLAGDNPSLAPSSEPFRVFVQATRSADHATILSASAPVTLGSKTTARTDSITPAENLPAVPSFTTTLSRTGTTGVYQLVTKVEVRETKPNKKGKLKRSQRAIGSLLPIRLGETQTASAPDDPVTVELRVERR